MADAFSIRIVGLEKLMAKARDPRLVDVPAKKFLNRSGVLVAGNVRERTPVDTGRLRSSITHELRGTSSVRIGTNVKYAPSVEFGSQPHFPPVAALQPWARRHGFPAGTGGAFLVARAISRRGTKPREMFKKGLAASLGDVRRFLGDFARDIERRWGR